MKKSKKVGLPLVDKWDGTPEGKARLHKGAQQVLRALAAELGLKKGEFEVRSNEMGPAIGGTIHLDAKALRVWIEGGYGFTPWGKSAETGPRTESYVAACRCEGGKDKGSDLVVDWELLWDPKKLVEVLRLEGFA